MAKFINYPTAEPQVRGAEFPKIMRFLDDGLDEAGEPNILRVQVWDVDQEADAKKKYKALPVKKVVPGFVSPEKPAEAEEVKETFEYPKWVRPKPGDPKVLVANAEDEAKLMGKPKAKPEPEPELEHKSKSEHRRFDLEPEHKKSEK